ncbi:LytS/YhcK type 5TM receptor domain-containing protein [Methylomonas rapida]|uniref:histidine kinase n=1 Tax=Methylomonas rapida TaxID=2963939 RepID=A0ABY7GPF9_9GAMM|nr:LytS/YhcK type 5TM receptor domain-containing protein [Methylomonas rapida]WAR46365.1 PAS domain S-box protein [Methylomonas rapida]
MTLPLLDFSFSLLLNSMLLLGLAQIVDMVLSPHDGGGLSRPAWVSGMLVGGVGLILIKLSISLMPGIIFDSRSVLLAISGLFLGFGPTAIAMAMTAAYRWFMGGPATLTGVLVILVSGLIGVIWRRHWHNRLEALNWRQLYAMGLIVHGAMLGLMLLMPWPMARQVLATISLPVLLLFPLLTVALGLSLVDRLRHRRDQQETLRQLSLAKQEACRLMEDAITARKQAEASLEALQEQRDLNQRYLDTVQTVMVALDSQGCITMINRFGCELLGYGADELIGRNWFACCLPQPEGMTRVYPVFCRIMAGELQGAEYFENAVRCRDGRLHLIAWHNAHLTDEEGRIVGTLGSGEDITERKQAELSLKARNEELERFNLAMVDRENAMVELKRHINALHVELGRNPPFDLSRLEHSVDEVK